VARSKNIDGGEDIPASNEETNEDSIEETNEDIEVTSTYTSSQNIETPQERLKNLSRRYVRENMVQAVSYVATLLITYGFYAMTSSHVLKFSRATDATAIFFLPLGGFFNIMVYTRPMVAELRRRHPECGRVRGFWLVLRAGGQIPDDIDLSVSCCQDCFCSPGWDESEHDDATPSNRDYELRRSTGASLFAKLSRLGFW